MPAAISRGFWGLCLIDVGCRWSSAVDTWPSDCWQSYRLELINTKTHSLPQQPRLLLPWLGLLRHEAGGTPFIVNRLVSRFLHAQRADGSRRCFSCCTVWCGSGWLMGFARLDIVASPAAECVYTCINYINIINNTQVTSGSHVIVWWMLFAFTVDNTQTSGRK